MRPLIYCFLLCFLAACSTQSDETASVLLDDESSEFCEAPVALNDAEQEDVDLENFDYDSSVELLVELGTCEVQVQQMFSDKGGWRSVTETDSSTSNTHYYFKYADDGYGFQVDSGGICRTNYSI